MTLEEMLSKIEDPRSAHGLRYRLKDLLLMCIMAIMSGHYTYRGMGRFLKNNEKDIRKTFGSHHGVPCYVSIRDVLQSIDFEDFATTFNEWASQYVPMCKSDTKSVDGKAIGGTTSNPHDAFQNFVSIENRLHWVKDVCMNEDKAKTISGMAAENISILRNIVINIFRTNGYDSIKYATEICSNNLKLLIMLTNCKPMNYIIT